MENTKKHKILSFLGKVHVLETPQKQKIGFEVVSTFKDTMVWYYLYIRGKLKALTKVVLLVTLVYFSLLFCVGASVKSDQLLGFYLFILVGFIKKRNNVKPITNFTTIFLTCHSITLAIKN